MNIIVHVGKDYHQRRFYGVSFNIIESVLIVSDKNNQVVAAFREWVSVVEVEDKAQ